MRYCIHLSVLLICFGSVNHLQAVIFGIGSDFNAGLPGDATLHGSATSIVAPMTVDDFDSNRTPSVTNTYNDANAPHQGVGQPPLILSDGGVPGQGNFLFLTPSDTGQNNRISYDRTTAGPTTRIVMEFDYANRPDGSYGDGFGVAFFDTAIHGTSGVGPPAGVAPKFEEDPNVVGSFGVGFDIFDNDQNNDPSDNHVSFHYDAATISQSALDPVTEVDLVENFMGTPIPMHMKIELKWLTTDSALATVTVIPDFYGFLGGPRTPVVREQVITGITPYEARVAINARSGGLKANFFYDNIVADFGPIDQGGIQLTPATGNQLGGLSFDDPTGGQAVDEWGAWFDFRIVPGNDGDGADGISLSFSRLGDVGATDEEGSGTGLGIGFDTHPNGGEISGNHLNVRFDGSLLQEIDLTQFGLILEDGMVHHAELNLQNGLLDVLIDGQTILDDFFVDGWQPYAGQFVLGARTGGKVQYSFIDNFDGFVDTAESSPVPEPNSALLLMVGAVGLFARRRKNR